MLKGLKAALLPLRQQHGVEDDEFWKAARQGADSAVFDALKDFGALMVAETQARTAVIDSKATSLLGWHAAASGFFLTLLVRFEPSSMLRWFIVIGAVVSAAGTIYAYAALRVRGVMIPSEQEWLEPELTAARNVFEIRRRHLLLMLRWHRSDCDVNAKKAHWAKVAQACLVVVGILLAAAVLLVAFAIPGPRVGA